MPHVLIAAIAFKALYAPITQHVLIRIILVLLWTTNLMQTWINARRDPELAWMITNRIKKLREQGVSYRIISKTIKDEFSVAIGYSSVQRILNPKIRIKEAESSKKWLRNNRERQRLNSQSYHKRSKIKSLMRISDGNPVCAVCGCPHINALTIGHFKGDGAEHRKEVGGSSSQLMRWVLYAPIDEVRARIRVECFYCNYFHAKNKRYPSEDEMPTW